MTINLTIQERELLQRHYDGALEGTEAKQAVALLERSAQARVFVNALEELTVGVRAAETHAWDSADAPAAATVVAFALEATELSEAPLHELAPLLERFHDGEVAPAEEATVHALLQERDDVADYLASLQDLSAGIGATGAALADDVDFGGFWDAVATKIDADETAYQADEHRVLLYRYADGEASSEEVAQVESWMAAGNPEVAETLATLEELQFAATAAIERAQEKVDLTGLWHRVEGAIDDEIESQGDNVVSLGRKRTQKATFFQQYQQGIAGAVAAILCLGIVGLFSDQIFGPRETRVIEKTIVVVEEVEYAPGTTGAVLNPPVRPASASIESGDAAEQEQEPTVIWVFEDEAPADGADEAGAPADAQENTEQPEEAQDDAGKFGGQPI